MNELNKEEKEKGEGKNETEKMGKAEEVYRIAISKNAEKALVELIEKVNQSFDSGKVNKTEMASWALLHLNNEVTASLLQKIRADHFDEFAALESLYRRARETGLISNELKQLLHKQIGTDGISKKNAKAKIDK